MNFEKRTILYALKSSLPVMSGYIVLGIGFGILMNRQGLAWYFAILMSCFIYAGSLQYAAVDLLCSSANLITIALVSLSVNARHLFYGLSMLQKYEDTGKIKPYLIFALTDETYSLVCDANLPSDINVNQYYFLISLMNQCYWIIGSALGVLLGSALSFNFTGIEFSMTALFTVTMIEQWQKNKNHLPALTGLSVSIVCLLIFGPADFLIPAMILISLLLIGEKKFMEGVNLDE